MAKLREADRSVERNGQAVDAPSIETETEERVRNIVSSILAAAPVHVDYAVDEFLEVARCCGHVRVSCNEAGTALCVRIQGTQLPDVPLSRARGLLRSMCSRLAFRSNSMGEIVFGGVAFVPPSGQSVKGWSLSVMNTMNEHWFDVACRDGWDWQSRK